MNKYARLIKAAEIARDFLYNHYEKRDKELERVDAYRARRWLLVALAELNKPEKRKPKRQPTRRRRRGALEPPKDYKPQGAPELAADLAESLATNPT